MGACGSKNISEPEFDEKGIPLPKRKYGSIKKRSRSGIATNWKVIICRTEPMTYSLTLFSLECTYLIYPMINDRYDFSI
jgi:hypothetical protein